MTGNRRPYGFTIKLILKSIIKHTYSYNHYTHWYPFDAAKIRWKYVINFNYTDWKGPANCAEATLSECLDETAVAYLMKTETVQTITL